MKKTLVATIIGLATVVSTFAQGRVNLNTYNTSPYPQITYGAGSGGTVGSPIPSSDSFTVGIYWAAGVVSVAADPTGTASIESLGSLTLGTGAGSTSILGQSPAGPGWFVNTSDFVLPGVTSGDATFVIVAYNGADYASSTVRGHSAAFTLTPAQLGAAPGVGSAMGGFQVFSTTVVPEPSTFALAGLGLAGLLIFRRRK